MQLISGTATSAVLPALERLQKTVSLGPSARPLAPVIGLWLIDVTRLRTTLLSGSKVSDPKLTSASPVKLCLTVPVTVQAISFRGLFRAYRP